MKPPHLQGWVGENSRSKILLMAEVGSTHDGSIGNAFRLVDAAADAGADVVKFQIHMPEFETVRHAPNPPHFSAESRWDYLNRTSFTFQQWAAIKSHADSLGITFTASPFCTEAVHILEALEVDLFKIPSGEVTNIPMLEVIASLGKPVFLSSGMSNWAELDAAVTALSETSLTILQCSSVYPCPPHLVGLNVLGELRERYRRPVGLSDHSVSHVASLAAAALGASVIEKHLTLSRWMYGSDAPYSLEPHDFRQLASDLVEISALRNNVVKDDISTYSEMKRVYEKSVVAARFLPAGTRLSMTDLAFKKPGDGFPARDYRSLIGGIVTRSIEQDEQLNLRDIQDPPR